MKQVKIADLFKTQERFLRSTHLARDFHDPSALSGYIVTPSIRQTFERLGSGLIPQSGQRAWRITGDYGSGKSSFALLLAHAFSGKDSDLPPQIQRSIDLSCVKATGTRFLPVLITGSREALARAVLKGLGETLGEVLTKRPSLRSLVAIRSALSQNSQGPTDDEALALVRAANSEIIAKNLASGLLIIIDELGKFLEYSALHPERQDIFFLQQLAEASARSGRQPFFTIGLLHQGFQAYADQLSQSAQREWEKVAGRFEEILFDQPLEQIVHLIGAALNVSESAYPRGWVSQSVRAMKVAISNGWFGSAPPISSLISVARTTYPIHPTTIPVLVRLFSRFGQNERSLFSFLLSGEPFALQDFAASPATLGNLYRIHHLYDYAAATFGHRLSTQGYRNHWNHIDSLIRSFPSANDIELAVLKTVGLLNLINVPSLSPSEEAIVLAIGDTTGIARAEIRKAIQKLQKEKHVLYHRGKGGGYCLWSHTSVNLDAVYEEATRAVGTPRRVASLVQDKLNSRPIVARRHYIQTGNLRHFELVYCSMLDLEKISVSEVSKSDGRIIVPLCETTEEKNLAMLYAKGFRHRADTLIGITEPLASLSGLICEAERWAWVKKNTHELRDDRYAAEEVARQSLLASQTLEKLVQHYVGLKQSSQSKGEMPIQWFYRGRVLQIESASELLGWLSKLCDDLFNEAPEIHNELVNRRRLSSTASAARGRLIARMLTEAHKPYLGMDCARKPPEMSMYLSVLARSGLHRQRGGAWTIVLPTANQDPCRLEPGLSRIRSILASKVDQRVTAESIFEELRRPPYGIRDGLLPLLLLAVLIDQHSEIALYEDGTFLSRIGPEEIFRLVKRPSTFDLQLFPLSGVRRALFDNLLEILRIGRTHGRQSLLLDVVRPLCLLVAQLPEYSRATSHLTESGRRVRDAILSAREPGTLLFTVLPQACGYEPFRSRGSNKPDEAIVRKYSEDLKACLDELQTAFPRLRDKIRGELSSAFDWQAAIRSEFRPWLTKRVQDVIINIRDQDLKAFCVRIIDTKLSESEWIESIASYVATAPPSRWKDGNELVFKEKLEALVKRFARVESMSFSGLTRPDSESVFRVTLTARDGEERDGIIATNSGTADAANELAKRLGSVLTEDMQLSLYALSRLTWDLLEAKK